jgi:hypothetical protein
MVLENAPRGKKRNAVAPAMTECKVALLTGAHACSRDQMMIFRATNVPTSMSRVGKSRGFGFSAMQAEWLK